MANTLLFIGFTGPLAWVVYKLIPDRPATGAEAIRRHYLDDLLDTPALALDRVRMELRRFGERAHDMDYRALPVVIHGIETEIIVYLKRVYYFAERIAKAIPEQVEVNLKTRGTWSKRGTGLTCTRSC